MKHELKRLKGYIVNSKRVYECTCGALVEGWNKEDAEEKHEREVEEND